MGISRYVRDCFQNRRGLLVLFWLTSLGRTAAAMVGVLLIQQFLSAVLGTKGRLGVVLAGLVGHDHLPLAMAGLLLFALMVAAGFEYWNAIVTQRAVEVLELGLMERLIRHLLTLSVPYFHGRTHGDIIQTVRQDVVQLRIMVDAYATVLLEGMLVLGTAAVLLWLSPVLVFWSLVLVPFVGLGIMLLTVRRLRALSHVTRGSGFVLFDVILQLIGGLRVIKAYQAEEAEVQEGVAKGKVFFASLLKAVHIRAFSEVVMQTTGGVCFVVVIAVGTVQVAHGALTWPKLLAFAMAVRGLFAPLFNLYGAYLNIPTYAASMERIDELLRTEPIVRERPDARPYRSAPRRVRFEHVGLAYDGPPVLRDISFEVGAGEAIGIVGASGAGKSTLLNLIVRFLDPTTGRVLFDEHDLRDLRLGDVYDKIAIVTQDPFLFAASVRENIRCGRPGASDGEVEAAAKDAFIHDEIMAMPAGYGTAVGAGGREVSRGQAQRINVARALLKGAPILVLDEATSSLDSVGEAEVQKSINRLMEGRTSFVVAHRLSTLRNVNRILMLAAGHVAGFDAHEALLHNCPPYRHLWDLQQLGGSLAPDSPSVRLAKRSPAVAET